jgi:hypothetical protein
VRSIRADGLLGLLATLALAASATVPQAPTTVPRSTGPAPAPSLGAGVDISFPQCAARSHIDLPTAFPFAVVGLNGGKASTLNPCFQSEYNSALLLPGDPEQPPAAVYVNTGNPALAATWWPANDVTESGTPVTNPDGSCKHKAGAACAYVYGYAMAEADYRYANRSLARLPSLWWLDVETTNSWQTNLAANAASLSGMVDYFHSRGLTVGIYSTSYQWKKIAGVTSASSDLAGLRSWLAGGSPLGAPADCEGDPLTPNGWVAMVQYVSTLDNDFSCGLFPSALATLAPSDPPVVGSLLSAQHVGWVAGASYSYQWIRDGEPIKGATEATYPTTASDLGREISVSITGRKLGYSTRSASSQTVQVLGLLNPQPLLIEGKFTSGSTLTAMTKAWGPSSVSLFYAWYRGGKLVESGTVARKYVLTGADVGQPISVTVTGSEPGYAEQTRTAVSPPIAQ